MKEDFVLRTRRLVPERMDDPSLDAADHRRALRGLARINRVSLASWYVWSGLREALPLRVRHGLRVLDVACGGGDVTLGLQRCANRMGAGIKVDGCDLSPVAVATATEAAKRAALDSVFFVHDICNGALPGGYDAITCSLFLHHLEADVVRELLVRMRRAASVVVIDDLRRHPLGHAAAVLGTRALCRSRVVHVDGPRSVRAAFTAGELATLAGDAGMKDAVIKQHFPWRMRMIWKDER